MLGCDPLGEERVRVTAVARGLFRDIIFPDPRGLVEGTPPRLGVLMKPLPTASANAEAHSL